MTAMPVLPDRSCYVLETSVQPGGSRWAELHAYVELADIHTCLAGFLANSDGNSTYHAIRYGMVFGVWTVQRGELVDFLDLHRFVTVHHPDHPPVPLIDDDATGAIVYARRRQIYLADGAEEDDIPGPDEWDDCDIDVYSEMTMSIDWPSVLLHLSVLTPPLLAPGHQTPLHNAISDPKKSPRGSYLRSTVRYGSHDVENGNPLLQLSDFEDDDEDDEDDDEDDEADDDDDADD